MNQLLPITVLITGAGAPGAPGIIKSLRWVKERSIRIIGVDASLEESIGVGMVDKAYEVPLAKEDNFIKEILQICIEEKVNIIIPLVTRELIKFSESLEVFEKHHVKVSISFPDALTVANNKKLLMQYAIENHIPVPEFYPVSSIGEFKNAAFQLGYPEKKICFKPPVSNGLRGFRIISDGGDKMEALINEKPNNVYIGFEEFIQIASDSKNFPELLVMEYLPGDEYSVDVLVNKGKFISAIPRKRDKIKMGISFVGTTEQELEIISYSKKIVEGLKLHGNIGLQFKRDEKGIPKLIESNPRVQGTIILCTAAGENMVYEAVKIAMGEPFEVPTIQWGTRMVRYWDELFFFDNQRMEFE